MKFKWKGLGYTNIKYFFLKRKNPNVKSEPQVLNNACLQFNNCLLMASIYLKRVQWCQNKNDLKIRIILHCKRTRPDSSNKEKRTEPEIFLHLHIKKCHLQISNILISEISKRNLLWGTEDHLKKSIVPTYINSEGKLWCKIIIGKVIR